MWATCPYQAHEKDDDGGEKKRRWQDFQQQDEGGGKHSQQLISSWSCVCVMATWPDNCTLSCVWTNSHNPWLQGTRETGPFFLRCVHLALSACCANPVDRLWMLSPHPLPIPLFLVPLPTHSCDLQNLDPLFPAPAAHPSPSYSGLHFQKKKKSGKKFTNNE